MPAAAHVHVLLVDLTCSRLLAWLGLAPIVLAFLGLLACLLGSVGWLAVWLVGLLASLLLLCVVFLYPHDRCQHFAIVSEDSPRMGSPN